MHVITPITGPEGWHDLPWFVVSREELARRIRAARAYANLTQEELAERVGMGEKTISQSERGERDIKRWELWGIAEVCNVPREFFEAERLELPPKIPNENKQP